MSRKSGYSTDLNTKFYLLIYMIRSELNLSRVMEDKGDYGVGPYYIEGV